MTEINNLGHLSSRRPTKLRVILKEIILENFMSYEYARIAMKPGLNLICGPNGSGKSSILLAISVALGQIYTERSRKLSDLIRWGKDIARVSLTFEKLEKEKSDSYEPTESFTLSRYLKSDGTYWYESDFRTISKNELLEILSEFGINANNMLIIMHQNMIEEFSVTTPQQKLLMVEDAVGFQFYREKIFDAQNKLTKLLSEEESVAQLLENATQTLAFWKGEYDKYLKRKQLLDRKKTLEIELAWSQAIRMERAALSLKEKLSKKEKALGVNASKIGEIKDSIEKSKQALFEIRSERRKLFSRLIETVRSETNTDTRAQVHMDLESKLDHLFKTVGSFTEKTHSQEFRAVMVEVDEIRSYLLNLLKNGGQSKEELTQTIRDLENQIAKKEDAEAATYKEYLDQSVGEAILHAKKETLGDEIMGLKRELREIEKEYEEVKGAAEKTGSRIDTSREPLSINEEIKVNYAYLASVGEVSEEAETMYNNYSTIYNDMKEKIDTLSENRKKTLQELETRKEIWKRVLEGLLEDVDPSYQEILSKLGASGKIRLVNMLDLEEAGVELLVGFKGATPKILDSYTQSGGERSVSTVAFLLALQRHVKSPFRAVDEFDVHMDPRNREFFSNVMVSTMGDEKNTQYIIITPQKIPPIKGRTHIIAVQSVGGRSEVKVVSQ